MRKREIAALRNVVEYLADEDQHFEENCICVNKEQDGFDAIKDCNCEPNQTHIYKEAIILKAYLERITNK